MNSEDKVLRYKKPIDEALGNLLELINDKNITDINVNSNSNVYIDTQDKGLIPAGFDCSNEMVIDLLKVVADMNGVIVNRANTAVKGTIDFYKARVQGIIPPNVKNGIVSIRIPRTLGFSLDDFVEAKSMTPQVCDYIKTKIKEGSTILVAGSTGSGKTALLDAILKEYENTHKHIVIIEDTEELVCKAPNKSAIEYDEVFTCQRAVKAALRLNPDILGIGEIRGKEALDAVKAFNSGHIGFASIHSNNAPSALDKLNRFMCEAEQSDYREDVAEGIDIVIQTKRIQLTETSRRRIVSEVIEVDSYKNSKWCYNQIYKFL